MAEAVFEALARNEVKLADLQMLICHQANLRINEYLQKQVLQIELPNSSTYNLEDPRRSGIDQGCNI